MSESGFSGFLDFQDVACRSILEATGNPASLLILKILILAKNKLIYCNTANVMTESWSTTKPVNTSAMKV